VGELHEKKHTPVSHEPVANTPLSVAVTVVLVAQVSEQTVPSAFNSEREICTGLDDAVCTLTGEQPGGAPVQQLRAAAACPATPPAAG